MDTTREPDFAGPAVPGYRLIRPLSRSLMSQVYLAEHVAGQQGRVALKIVDLSGVRPELVARFRTEISIARDLRHPHIVETYQAGESAGYHYLAMRYVDGPDLGRLLREQGPLEIGRTVEIAGQIAAALDTAHSRQLVHRDVKPANILLENRTGRAYLCDFGIAKDLRAQTITQDGVPLTPLYAAPEQQSGGRVSHRADVYALAGVIYHCLTGHAPFDRFTTREVFQAHLQDPPPRASTARPGLPPLVDEVFLRGLAKRPEHRYSSCSELVADLAAVLGGWPRPPLPPLPRWRSRRGGPSGGRRRLVRLARHPGVIAGGVLVLLAAAVLIVQPWHRQPTAGPPGSTALGATSTPDAAFPTAAERSLISLVGDGGCRRATADETRGFSGLLGAVDCTPAGSGATSESYYQFDSVADLRTAFDRDAAAAKAPNGVDCAQGKAPGFLGNQRYDLRSVDLGGLQCRPGANSGLVMEWSVEPLRVLGSAVGADPASLAGWWRGYYGPPTSAIVTAINKQATPQFPTPRETTLLAHIPPASRDNCVRPSDKQVKLNVGDTPVVGVVCGPTSGAAIIFYYQFPSAAAMSASYGLPQPNGTDCTTVPSGFAGEHAYSRGGQTGRLQCITDDNTQERSLVWTDDQLSIEGMAFQGGDPAAMIDWWLNDAGPS